MSTYFLSLDLYLWNFDGKIRIKFMCNLEKWYAAAKSLQLCLTLCDPIDGSPPGSPVPGILQARTLEWVVISFSNAWKWKVKVKSLNRVRLLATPRTAAYQAPLSVGFSRQEYWSGVPYRWSYLQSRNKDTDIEDNCMDTSGGKGRWDELGNRDWHLYIDIICKIDN